MKILPKITLFTVLLISYLLVSPISYAWSPITIDTKGSYTSDIAINEASNGDLIVAYIKTSGGAVNFAYSSDNGVNGLPLLFQPVLQVFTN